MRAAAAHAVDDGVERHVKFQHVVQLHAGGLHGVGLGNGAGKTVEQETVGAVRLGNAFLDQVDDEIVTDEAAGFHHGLGLYAQGGARLHGCAQHVTGGNLGDAVFLADERGLGAFASAGSAQQNQSHRCPFFRVSNGEAACLWRLPFRPGARGRPVEDSMR
ncbi:hypothetical protein D9M69_578240 [compost metagenome]